MTSVPFIDLKAQYERYRSEIDAAVAAVLESSVFVQGPEIKSLEEELATYTGTRHCVSCASGTDALYIALRALGIGRGDEVIVPGFSFFATAATVSLVGANPVFVDIDPRTCNIDPTRAERAITARTRAIVPVGLYGQPADMDAICDIACRHAIPVVEDAAQSFGAVWDRRRSGSLGTIGCTSFYPAKPLGSYGEGGALFTDDDALAETIRQLMNQGQRAGYDHSVIGVNGRMHALQAAILRVKLRHFDDEIASRHRVASGYHQSLASVTDVQLPWIDSRAQSVYAQFTLRVSDRERFRAVLSDRGVPTAVHYPKPMYAQDAYGERGEDWLSRVAADCPECERASREVVSLPFGPFLSSEDQERVVLAVLVYEQGGE